MPKKSRIGVKIGDLELNLFKIHKTMVGDVYIAMLNQILKGTGFHLSFHKSGEIHFKINKPAEITVKVKLEDLELLFKDILNIVLREPIDYSECMLCYLDANYNPVVPNSYGMIDTLEVLKRMKYVTTTSKDLSKKLLELVNSGNIVKNKDLVAIVTDRNELIFYKPLGEEKLKELSDNPLTSDKSWLFYKYGGAIATVSTSKENNPLIKIFEKYMPGVENLFDSVKELANTNASVMEPEFENFGKLIIKSINLKNDEFKETEKTGEDQK
ncbi:MAG: hypothetical protein ACP5ML_02135 [Fervidicoccus sp.]